MPNRDAIDAASFHERRKEPQLQSGVGQNEATGVIRSSLKVLLVHKIALYGVYDLYSTRSDESIFCRENETSLAGYWCTEQELIESEVDHDHQEQKVSARNKRVYT